MPSATRDVSGHQTPHEHEGPLREEFLECLNHALHVCVCTSTHFHTFKSGAGPSDPSPGYLPSNVAMKVPMPFVLLLSVLISGGRCASPCAPSAYQLQPPTAAPAKTTSSDASGSCWAHKLCRPGSPLSALGRLCESFQQLKA